MKASFVDATTSDQDCLDFLGRAFHSTIPRDDHDDSSDSEVEVADTCHKKFGGLCQHSRQTEVACKLSRILNRSIVDNDIEIGSLLLLTTGLDSFMGFLGSCMKKPILQTFLKASRDPISGEISFRNPIVQGPNCDLTFTTGHKLFSQISVEDEPVHVQVWDYRAQVRGSGLMIQSTEVRKEFTLDPTAKISVRKPRGKVAFGKNILKKRRQEQSKQKKQQRSAQSKSKGQRKSRKEENKQKKKRKRAKKEENSSSDSSDSSDSSRSKSVNKICDDSGQPLSNHDQESEVVIPVSAAAKQEDTDANALILEQDLAKDRAIEAADQQAPAATAEAASSSSTMPAVQGRNPKDSKPVTVSRGTFFSATVGLDDIGIAVSARSSCYYCQNKIGKGSIRFCWHHSTLRPSVWVHKNCLIPLARRDKLESQVKGRLEQLRAKPIEPAQALTTIDDLLSSMSGV